MMKGLTKDAKIYVAGHRGMVGSALVRNLQSKGFRNILTRTRSELDLLDQPAVREFLESERPEYVFVAAAKVGGIYANDNYDLNNSHVLPALIRKAHEARLRGDKELVVWGTGNPMREFLYVDDLADACVFLMETGVGEGLFNVGTGEDVTIRELAETVM